MSNQNKAADTILDTIPFQLAQTLLAFTRVSAETLRDEGLKPQALGVGSVLYALFEEDDVILKSLIQVTHLPKGTLTGILNRLERDGFISRHPDTQDGRACRVKLTAKGRALEAKMRRRHDRFMQMFQSSLSERELCTLTRLLSKAMTAMRSNPSPLQDLP